MAYYGKHREDLMEASLKALKASFEESPFTKYCDSIYQLYIGKPEGVIQQLNDLMREFQTSIKIINLTGVALLQQSMVDKAAKLFERAIKDIKLELDIDKYIGNADVATLLANYTNILAILSKPDLIIEYNKYGFM